MTMSGTKRNHSPSKSPSNGGIGSENAAALPPAKRSSSDGAMGGEADASECANSNSAPMPSSPKEEEELIATATYMSCPPPTPTQAASTPPHAPQSTVASPKKGSGNDDDEKKDKDDLTSKDYYFDSYSHHGIHEEMLKDEVRTRTYQMAIANNRALFEGKVVLDVGCGTGILSMFAARAGAAHVYAVDCSSIIEQAARIVEDNGFADRITLIRGKIEEIDLPVKCVDVIVSEWMGYFLLYESMLNTVLCARDRWLRPAGNDGEGDEGGVVFPDKAVMYLCACEDEQMKYERIDFWEDVYGFDMRALGEVALKEPVVDVVDPKSVVTNSVPILNIDLQHCTPEDLSFASPFRLRAQRRDRVHSFVAYFECAFTRVPTPLGFSTSPFSKYTHWKQTIFYLKEPISVDEGEEIVGTISCRPNPKNGRDLDIALDINFNGTHSRVSKRVEYRLR